MKSIKINYMLCLKIILLFLINNVQLSRTQLLASMLANNKPIHPAQTVQQTARAAVVSGGLSRADFKQPKLDKRNVWTPISNLNQQEINHNQTIKLGSITNSLPTTTPSSAQKNRSTINPMSNQKSQQLTDMLKAKLKEGRISKKSVVDVDLPESNLRLVFDLNNLDKLQTQQTQESSQKIQRAVSKTNTKSKPSNLVAGVKGGVKGTKSNNINSKGELKSVREQLKLINDKNQANKTTSPPQHFHIGYIRASDLRKVINSGFSMNDMPTDISNNQTEKPILAKLLKPAPAKIQSKTSPAKSNLEQNDLETISQKDISSSKLILDKKAIRKTIISPKQAHYGLRDKKSHSANLIADTKSPIRAAENENDVKSSPAKGNDGTKKPRQQQSVSSRSVPFSTTTSATPTAVQPTTRSSIISGSGNSEIESEGNNDESSNQEGTTTTSSLFARMATFAASFSSMTTTSIPTTIVEQNSESSAAALSVTASPSDSAPSSSNGQIEEKTNSPSTISSNLISSNDQQQKDVEVNNEESNLTEDNDDEDQNNSLAAIAEQLNNNYGGFGTRNRLLQRPNSTKSTQHQTQNNAVLSNLIAGTKGGANRAVVSVQPLNLKTSAFVVEDSQQSTTTNNNDNEGLIEVKDDGSKNDKVAKPEQNESDQLSTSTEGSLDSKNNNGDEEFTLINNNDQNSNSDGQTGKLNQGVLIQRTSSGKAIKFAAINNASAHSAPLSCGDEAADDYEDGFEDVNEIEIIDTSKPTNTANEFQGNGAPLIIRPFPLSATCACAPLTTINNVLSSGTSSQSISKRLRILAKELGAENLFNKFSQAEQHLQKRLEAIQSTGKDGYTLFLPSDEALERLPLNLIHHWEKKPEEFTRVLDNHIVRGEPRKLAHLLELRTLTSIANNNSSSSVIRFNHYRNDTFTANGQRIIYGDQPCPNNGVLHIMDGMLYPLADKNILETLKSCNRFEGFVTLAQGTGLSDTLIQRAGFHKSEEKYRKCLIESTSEAKKISKNGGSALEICAKAVEILENDPSCNAGRGSALNLNCEVQCDASLMQSADLNWAGVGSLSNIANPILAAKSLLYSQQTKHPDDLINPCFLVGDGAKKWAIEHGCLESYELVTDQAIDLFEKHRFEITKLKEQTISSTINEQFIPLKKRKRGESTSSVGDLILREHGYVADSFKSKEKILDTVGAVAIDQYGNVASAVSSGGIMFKDEGRIGQAAVYGAGCWAEDNVAVTTTGVGEYLIKTSFAKKCASKLLKASGKLDQNEFDKFSFDNVLKSTFINHFLNSKYLKTTDHDKLIGILSLVANSKDRMAQLIWAHNTPSMFLAYSTGDGDTEIVFSRTSNTGVEARSLLVNY